MVLGNIKERVNMGATYDLAQSYTNQMARGIAAAQDWELLGLFEQTPKDYHLTKDGLPDKRFKNYPEVLAYHEALLDQRADWINQATQT